MRSLQLGLLAACLLGLAPTSALAQGQPASTAVEFTRQAERLKPGQWVWAPNIAPSGPVLVYVDLKRQLATVYRNGVRIAVTTVSSGKPGYETPTGVFTILQKDAKHRSSTYNNASMPFTQRLTWKGVALHAGGLPGYPESHGCVHLPLEFARKLFGTTAMGGTVIVSDGAGPVSTASGAGVLAATDAQGRPTEHRPLPSGDQSRWEPQKAPTGPISLIVSRADQRLIVLRNGVEIGRSRVNVSSTDTATHVYTYEGMVNGQRKWMVAGVPGHAGAPLAPVQPWALEGIDVPPTFLAAVRTILSPGATILVTQARVLPANSGQSLTVLSSD